MPISRVIGRFCGFETMASGLHRSTKTPSSACSSASIPGTHSAVESAQALHLSRRSSIVTMERFGSSHPSAQVLPFTSHWGDCFMQATLPILIVEDSPEDFEAAVRAFSKAKVPNPIYRFSYGEDAFDFLKQRGRYFKHGAEARPGLLILDLNLPGTDGLKLLQEIP